MEVQTVKRHDTGVEKTFHCNTWDEFNDQLSHWLNGNAYVLVDESSPWDPIPHNLKHFPKNVTVMMLNNDSPKHQSITNPFSQSFSSLPSSSSSSSPFWTLNHFLNQPETKTDYFLRNKTYQDKLDVDIHRFLHTFKTDNSSEILLFERLVNKMSQILTSPQGTEHDALFHRWVLDFMSMGTQLPKPLSTQVKTLSHIVFDTVLYS